MQLNPKVTSNYFDRRLTQVACFGGAPVFLVCATLALGRLSATPAEFFIGLFAAAATAFGMVITGLLTGI